MSNINLNSVVENIRKSGFVLEHDVTELLVQHQWSVINNRYYVDDVQEIAREIDIVAYKARKFANVWIYTVLVISCKKSEENSWALLFRHHNKNDPNMDWYPVKVWSNSKILKFMTNQPDWRLGYLEKADDRGLREELFEPTGHSLAFQEIHKTKHTIQNDKNIFNAISSLMKAEAYEMSSLERRKKDIALYNFNLVSVVDTELIKLQFRGKKIISSIIDEAKCIINFIVNKRETSSRIHFCTLQTLDNTLKSYDRLHQLNYLFFKDLTDSFYTDIFSDLERRELLKENFLRQVLWSYNFYYSQEYRKENRFQSIDFNFRRHTDVLEVLLDADESEIRFLNTHDGVRRITKTALKNVYRYTGEFTFAEEGIPF